MKVFILLLHLSLLVIFGLGKKSMLKELASIVICLLMVSSSLVIVVARSNHVQNIATQNGMITVTIPVGAYSITKTSHGDMVAVEGYGRLLIPGKPNLPAKIFSIAIPPGAKVRNVTFEMKQGIVLPGAYWIAPCELPRVMGIEIPQLFKQDRQCFITNFNTIYGHNTRYPSSIGEVIGLGGYRKYNLIDVRISPFSYGPLTGTLTYYPDITVLVNYTISESDSPQRIMGDSLPRTEKTAQEIIINYNQAKNWYPMDIIKRVQYDYVIITTNALTSSVTSLVEWETAKGRNVNVVTTEWIGSNYQGFDLSAKIRAFLVEKFTQEEWGIEDVCLIGSPDDVPMRVTAQNIGYGAPETDYYYAELSLPDEDSWDANGNHQYGEDSDPIDFETEINVGRIPWSDPETVQSICEKSVSYQQNTDASFKKNILLLGAFIWDNTDSAVLMEAKIDQSWMVNWTVTRMYEAAQSSYLCDYDLTYNNVKTVWSEGTYAFVDWAGHGSPEAAYEYYPYQAFVDETTCTFLNDEYPSVIFADCCSNSDTDYLNIGQAMLKHGGVGFLGANKYAFADPGWYNPMSGSSQSFDYFFTTYCTSYNYTLGQAHQRSLRQMYTNTLWCYPRFEMFEWGSLFGNPDLTIGPVITNEPPTAPQTPVGITLGANDMNYTYSTNSTDPDGDPIWYLFDWDDGTYSKWVGPYCSGMTASSSHSWKNSGSYAVKVKAKDINGVTSGWSESLTIWIVIDYPPHIPTVIGPGTGSAGTTYLFTIQVIDIDGDDVYFFVDWGDQNTTGWFGPYPSGDPAIALHSWDHEGSYKIKIKAKDVFGREGSWRNFPIVMSLDIQMNQRSFNQFLYPVMRQLIIEN
jgi:hypothetical protein